MGSDYLGMTTVAIKVKITHTVSKPLMKNKRVPSAQNVWRRACERETFGISHLDCHIDHASHDEHIC